MDNVNPYTFPGLRDRPKIFPSTVDDLKAKLLSFCKERIEFQHITSWDKVATSGRRNRKPQEVLIRQMFHYVMKKTTKLSLTYIGKLTGGADHTTVIYSVKNIQDRIDTNDPFTMDLYNYLN